MQTRLIIIDPLWSSLRTPHHAKLLNNSGVVESHFDDLSETSVSKINQLSGDKIIFLNPDVFGWSLEADVLNSIKRCKLIITGSTSISWILNSESLQAPLQNIRNFSTDAVTDWCLMVILNLLRKVPLMIKSEFPLNYGSDFTEYRGTNLAGKKVGIIGLGNMGNSIARKCAALGAEVSYWSIDTRHEDYTFKELDVLFRESDILIPFFASNESTKKLITDNMICSMKKSVHQAKTR